MELSNEAKDMIRRLKALLDGANVDAAHDIHHAVCVFNHARKAIGASEKQMSAEEKDAVTYAALLHDADDDKIFPDSKGYQNARQILQDALPGQEAVHNMVIDMIELVSCSKNGNSTDGVPKGKEWMLYPRYADRLEAIGDVGLLRTYQYTIFKKRCLYSDETPRPTSEQELWAVATKERFASYSGGGGSASMIDHFYDKLLHLGPAFADVDNSYLREEALRRHQTMVDFVLDFGRKGEVDEQRLQSIEEAIAAEYAQQLPE